MDNFVIQVWCVTDEYELVTIEFGCCASDLEQAKARCLGLLDRTKTKDVKVVDCFIEVQP